MPVGRHANGVLTTGSKGRGPDDGHMQSVSCWSRCTVLTVARCWPSQIGCLYM